MKVKVTYTTDYDDIPELVNKMLSECRDTLQQSSNFKFNMFNLEESSSQILTVQKSLDLVASKLDDCLNIAHGYVQAQSTQKPPANDVVEQPEVLDEDS